jgi:hypothetical protein
LLCREQAVCGAMQRKKSDEEAKKKQKTESMGKSVTCILFLKPRHRGLLNCRSVTK